MCSGFDMIAQIRAIQAQCLACKPEFVRARDRRAGRNKCPKSGHRALRTPQGAACSRCHAPVRSQLSVTQRHRKSRCCDCESSGPCRPGAAARRRRMRTRRDSAASSNRARASVIAPRPRPGPRVNGPATRADLVDLIRNAYARKSSSSAGFSTTAAKATDRSELSARVYSVTNEVKGWNFPRE